MLSFCRTPSLFSRGICIYPQPTPQTNERAPLAAFRKMIVAPPPPRTALSCPHVARSVDEGAPFTPMADVWALYSVSPMRAVVVQTT